MFTEVDLLGAFAPILIVQFVGSLVIFVVADALLTKAGFFRLVWHAPLARFSLFAVLFCVVALRMT